jgi:hypothetical protein
LAKLSASYSFFLDKIFQKIQRNIEIGVNKIQKAIAQTQKLDSFAPRA